MLISKYCIGLVHFLSYACLKRNVLTSFLKLSKLLLNFDCSGNGFHRVGAAILNDLSTNVLHFDLGVSRRIACVDPDRSPCLVGFIITLRSLRYWGASSWRHLQVNTNILNDILCWIGNQCNSIIHWTGLSYFPLLSANLAHTCWTL